MGNGDGDIAPKRILIACIRKSAFLKQYTAIKPMKGTHTRYSTYVDRQQVPYLGKLGGLVKSNKLIEGYGRIWSLLVPEQFPPQLQARPSGSLSDIGQ